MSVVTECYVSCDDKKGIRHESCGQVCDTAMAGILSETKFDFEAESHFFLAVILCGVQVVQSLGDKPKAWHSEDKRKQ